jgi:antibiotic biosynthesis monooxygenase (ABM) superfamily enzyme
MGARMPKWNLLGLAIAGLALFGAGVLTGAGAFQRPKTVIEVVSIKWTADAAPELRRAALESVETMAGKIPGVRNIWLRTLRVQPRDFMTAYAIEFDDQAAAERFARHPAREAWTKTYLPMIEESRIQQVTN